MYRAVLTFRKHHPVNFRRQGPVGRPARSPTKPAARRFAGGRVPVSDGEVLADARADVLECMNG